MLIKIDAIQVNPGRRPVSSDQVKVIADSISVIGLLNPITIDRDNVLIAGLHRLEAAKLLSWKEIECNVCTLDGLRAELAEIGENIVRCDLGTV